MNIHAKSSGPLLPFNILLFKLSVTSCKIKKLIHKDLDKPFGKNDE
jgi:hypothetical protein